MRLQYGQHDAGMPAGTGGPWPRVFAGGKNLDEKSEEAI
jgi:hypothetical protein